MKRWGRNRYNFWVRALMVGVLLTGELHLFTAEIFHHHTEVAKICQAQHRVGTHLHAAPQNVPLCPICQIVSNGSIRPAVHSAVQKVDQESALQPVAQRAGYSLNLNQSLLARGPPLS